MSRIICKNLPSYCNGDRIRKHFQLQDTQITDFKLVTTSNNRSRKFCFIGYKTSEQAARVLEYFNGTFMDTCKLVVEIARGIGEQGERPWSKYSKGSSAFELANPCQESTTASKIEAVVDPKTPKENEDGQLFEEFLEVMRPRLAKPQRTWANDELNVDANLTSNDPKEDELYQDMPHVLQNPTDSLETTTAETVLVQNASNQVDVNNLSDLEYLKLKKQQSLEMEEKEIMNIHPARLKILVDQGLVDPTMIINKHGADKVEEETVEMESIEPKQQVQEYTDESMDPSSDTIADTGRIMVRNLPFSTTYEDLEVEFSRFGPIAELHLPMDKHTNESKGYCFVLYVLPQDAVKAFDEMHQSIFQGRILEIVAAKERVVVEPEISVAGAGYKAKREKEKKKQAGSQFNWSSLFMNSDAVAEAMARKLGVKKSEILDADSDNMAVKLAVAETAIINETTEYLEKQGVVLDSFNSKKRSSTVIIVKNIAATTTESDLLELFAEFGNLGRVLLPPARTLAVLEFEDRNEAKVAFRKLAYKKFKNLPLYLEWAPQGTFSEQLTKELLERKKLEKKQDEKLTAIKIGGTQDENEVEATATVFVKNLNFETSSEGLKRAFSGLNGLQSARVSMKPRPKTNEKMSMGFGFLEFKTKEDALTCIKTMQKVVLDGHELLLKFSSTAAKANTHGTRKRTILNEEKEDATKILVKNLPFEATKKDIMGLFSTFGVVKTVRIPRKFDGQHRGFGFVDFTTPHEAKKALSSLANTHLYGRHLVLEWAKEHENVDEIREKTAQHYTSSLKSKPKRQRIEMDPVDMDS